MYGGWRDGAPAWAGDLGDRGEKKRESLGGSAAERLKEDSVEACETAGETRGLETSDGIDLESLSLENSVLHWSVNGEPRESRLELGPSGARGDDRRKPRVASALR